jgi:lysophospholipase L1-like esterase
VPLPWRTFVALGDSMTEGVGDPVRGGTLRGWADRLAAALHRADDKLIYVNLARRSLRTEEVRRTQLDAALAAKPDLASALSGMNDLLDPGFDPARYLDDLDALVKPLTEAGALVLTATFPDITAFSPLPARLTRRVRARLHAASDAVREVSRRHGTLCLDADALPEPLERTVMSVDRLHPGPRGHVLVARMFARLLSGHSGVPIPEPEEADVAGRLAQARWLIRQLDPIEICRHLWRLSLAPARRHASS